MNLFIDPSYPVFDNDKLFDLTDPILNRDSQLLPFFRLREALSAEGMIIRTADHLFTDRTQQMGDSAYISLGNIRNYPKILSQTSAKLKAFVMMEPPVVAPELYRELPALTQVFESVYLHNINGDGYSLDNVNQARLKKFYWPLPFSEVLERYWSRSERLRKIVMINGNHKPRATKGEQYSTRMEALAALTPFDAIDLYGRDWEKWWSRESLWRPYWRNRTALMSVYRGPCVSKYEILSQYDFCLCFENIAMNGYISEKIFDCLYAGTIPLYLGAPDVDGYLPREIFVDCSKYRTWSEMWTELQAMPVKKIQAIRAAGRDFFSSTAAARYIDSLMDIAN